MAYEGQEPKPVIAGGTGKASFTAYVPICGGTTTTGVLQSLASIGTSGQILVSNGAGALPSFQGASASGAVTTLTGNSGGALSPTAGNINITGTGSFTVSGSGSTLTPQLTGLTNHNVLVGAGTATITNVAPSATAGVPLISAGAAADPSFGTALVAGGGTGVTSATAYALLAGGTTSTAAFQSIASVGTSGQVLTSNGAGALPTFQTSSSLTGITQSSTPFLTALGVLAGSSITSEVNNTFVGYKAGNAATSAFNTAIGWEAIPVFTAGATGQNTVIGSGVGHALTTGYQNIIMGVNTCFFLTTGALNTVIGTNGGNAYTTSESNNIVIGENCSGIVGESGALHIGDTGGSITKAYIAGIAGVTVTSTAAVLVNTSTSQLGTIISSKRYKENIEDMGDTSEVLYKLRPVKFTLKQHPENGQQTGLIAEEVLEVAPNLVALDKEGLPCSVSYHELPALLLNEIQKLNKRINELEKNVFLSRS